jgi:hypothetical protein
MNSLFHVILKNKHHFLVFRCLKIVLWRIFTCMKTSSLFLSAFLGITLTSTDTTFAQTLSEGVVTFTVTAEDVPSDKKEAALIPSTATHYSKGTISRLDFKSATGSSSLIMDHSSGKAVSIDGSTVVELSANDILQLQDREVRGAVRTEEKKTVAATSCTRFRMNIYHPSSDSFEETELWSAESTNLTLSPVLYWEGVRGCPLEFDLTRDGRRLHFVATKVEMKKVDPNLLVMPKATPQKSIANPEIKESKVEIK